MSTALPDLTSPDIQSTVIRHQASCASLSLALLSLLNNVLPQPPSLTLSVGSGPGLIEALLLHHFPARAAYTPVDVDTDVEVPKSIDPSSEDEPQKSLASFYGVEVKNMKSVNRYLPPENMITVPGTWALPPSEEIIISKVEGLLFIYPRQTGLLRLYLEKCTCLKVVVWIGPRCDEGEFTAPLQDWGVRDLDLDFGEREGEGEGEGDHGEDAASTFRNLEKRRVKLVEDGEVVAVYRKRS